MSTGQTTDDAASSLLFVCLGNICRSPLAELAMRIVADQHGLPLTIDSAGTGDWHIGNPPDHRAVAEARRHGHDISHYRARQVTSNDFHRFGHIIALDEQNLADLRAIAPRDATATLSLLLDHVPGREGEGVFDPYHGNADAFAETWDDVSTGADGLVRLFVAAR